MSSSGPASYTNAQGFEILQTAEPGSELEVHSSLQDLSLSPSPPDFGEYFSPEGQLDIKDDSRTDPYEIISNQDWAESVITCLSKKEAYVVVYSLGLFGAGPKTLDEIGKEFGVNPTRVYQVKQRALTKIYRSEVFRQTIKDLI